MPVRTTNAKAEAKYNVTTDFPNLGLHEAAASGNIGLVEYALAHGQPVNSALDGVLPLHAACAGGSEPVVKLLIDHGADVNALRLPRRYSNEKTRDGTAPIVGTSGSTPLHFASANGNVGVVTILLHRGAHADRPDKHGITPEMLARQNGHKACAEMLRMWAENKDKDLREREQHSVSMDIPRSSSPFSLETRRRLHVKRSIDTALSIFKATASSTGLADAYHRAGSALAHRADIDEPSSVSTSVQDDRPLLGNYNPNERRPSLPPLEHHSTSQSGQPSIIRQPPSPRRPHSAGTSSGSTEDADKEKEKIVYHSYGRGGAGRRTPKYSFLGLLRKASRDGGSLMNDSQASTSPRAATVGPCSEVALNTPPSVRHLSDASLSPPVPSPAMRRPSLPNPEPPNLSVTQARDRAMSTATGIGFEFDSKFGGFDSKSSVPIVERHNDVGVGNRDGSAFDDDLIDPLGESVGSKQLASILRSRNGSSSRSQSPGPRALRFDATSSGGGARSLFPTRTGLRNSSSVGSLPTESRSSSALGKAPTNSAALVEEDGDESDEEDGDMYGQVLSDGPSAAASSDQLHVVKAKDEKAVEFPFSISIPPPALDEPENSNPTLSQTVDLDMGRSRGASISSTDTSESQEPSLSVSETTVRSIGSVSAITPPLSSRFSSPALAKMQGSNGPSLIRSQSAIFSSRMIPTLNERRSHLPLGINIDSISSHAQADALVKQAEQDLLSVLDTEDSMDSMEDGWTPLSAHLAAYGESLAIQRQLREAQPPNSERVIKSATLPTPGQSSTPLAMEHSGMSTPSIIDPSQQQQAVSRQHSLKSQSDRIKHTVPRRPHTSESAMSPTSEFHHHNTHMRVASEGQNTHPSYQISSHSTVSTPGSAASFHIVSRSTSEQNSPAPQSRLTVVSELGNVSSSPALESSYRDVPVGTESSVGDSSANEHSDAEVKTLSRVDERTSSSLRSKQARPRNQLRNVISAQKLTRMGFSAAEATARNPGQPPPPPAQTSKRFGGLKSWFKSTKV